MSDHIRMAVADDLHAVEDIVRRAYAPYVVRGLIVLIAEDGVLLLDNIAVAPEIQGRKFGRLLLKHAEDIARRQGFSTIRLYTQEIMVENIAIYERVRYVETHWAEQAGLKRVFMVKKLSPTG